MSLSHTNELRYTYNSGGEKKVKTISKTETDSAEMNVSEEYVLGTPTETPLTLEYFEFTTAAKAKSVYLRLDGYNGTLKGGVDGASTMKALVDGEPYVWSYNGGTSFPPGTANPMVDATDMLLLVPDAGQTPGTTGTLTVSVLYDPA